MINCSVSNVAINKYHLLHVPPVGGKPIMLRLPIKNATIVKGICLPRPRISLMLLLCAATKIAPAQKNKVIFPKACIAIFIELAITPDDVARSTPIVI